MVHKDFDVTPLDKEGPTFTLAGRKFSGIAAPPAGRIQDILASRTGNNWSVIGMGDFIRGCLVADDESTWDELLRDKQTIITTQAMADVFEFLVEEYLARPTTQPSGSPDGLLSTTTTSTEDSP